MKKILDIAILRVKLNFRDKGALAWMFLAPIIFVTVMVFGFGLGNSGSTDDIKYPISIVNLDHGDYATKLINMVKNDKTFDVVELGYDEAKKAVEDKKIVIGFVIPDGFSKAIEDDKKYQIEMLKLQDTENTLAVAPVFNNYIYQLKIGQKTGLVVADQLSSFKLISTADKSTVANNVRNEFFNKISSPKITYSSSDVVIEKTGVDNLTSSAIGILVLFIMFFVTRATASMLEDKENKTMDRISTTPTHDYSITGGYILGTFILGWIQIGVMILFSKYVLHVNWGNSVLGLIMVFSAFLLAIIGLGAALSALVKTRAQLSTLSILMVMPTSLLAGCMWPKEIMPESMINASNFVPQTWVIKGITDLVTRGADYTAALYPSAILLIFASVFFIIGLTLINVRNHV